MADGQGDGAPLSDTYRRRIEDRILRQVLDNHLSLVEATREVQRCYPMIAEMVACVGEAMVAEASSSIDMSFTVADPETATGTWTAPLLKSRSGVWDAYIERLRCKRAPGADELDSTTSLVANLLAEPNDAGAKKRGLVLGNVQSGKTRHYAGVIAKAVDCGYRMVIVLAGMHNNLREQTQSRLDRDLFTDHETWFPLTEAHGDGDIEFQKLTEVLGSRSKRVPYAVVKKNSSRLDKLIKSLEFVPNRRLKRSPILIIDDEADQATPNSSRKQGEVSAINRKVRRVWELVETGTYLAYTATPFANVLMDPDEEGGLFPADFIQTLEPGEGYFGTERVFGIADPDPDRVDLEQDGLDMVRPVTDAENLRPPSKERDRESFDPPLPESLIQAVEWFVVASAIRRWRGQTGEHSSMLVHTTHYTAPHFAMRGRLRTLVDEMQEQVDRGDLTRFERAWDREKGRVDPAAGVAVPSWEEVGPRVAGVLGDIKVIVDNGHKLADRLNYGDEPQTVIAVGGGTLSRGLTLEGLSVSYFTRTSNAYDTLLQMGRWFGYRPGYEDLARVWVTDGLDRDYAFLARVEADLRDEIKSVQDSEFTPRQLGVKIRTHPGRLEVTGAAKMMNARIARMSFEGVRQQSFILDGSPETVDHNRRVLERLLGGASLIPVRGRPGRWIARGLATSAVSQFLTGFRHHPDQRAFADEERMRVLQDWLAKVGTRASWNVVVAGNSDPQWGTTRIAGLDVPMLSRNPMKGSTADRLDFKAMFSAMDRLADIPAERWVGENTGDEASRMRLRREHGGGQGLVLVYPLSRESRAPVSERRMTMPDGVGEGLYGFAIIHPQVDVGGDSGVFVSVRTSPEVESEAPEEDELEDEED